MGMNVKAIERKIAYLGKEGGKDQYMYVMQPLIYNKLTPEKVIQQAALHCGLTPAVMNVAYAALSEVIKAWATEGHSVAVPGLGTMRFGLRANAVKSVEDVSTKLITQRRVIFCPNMEIKQELAKTGISITCVNRDGEVVKNIASNDSKDVEDTEAATRKTLTRTRVIPEPPAATQAIPEPRVAVRRQAVRKLAEAIPVTTEKVVTM